MELFLYLLGNWLCLASGFVLLCKYVIFRDPNSPTDGITGKAIILVSKDTETLLLLGALSRFYWSKFFFVNFGNISFSLTLVFSLSFTFFLVFRIRYREFYVLIIIMLTTFQHKDKLNHKQKNNRLFPTANVGRRVTYDEILGDFRCVCDDYDLVGGSRLHRTQAAIVETAETSIPLPMANFVSALFGSRNIRCHVFATLGGRD